MSLLPGYRLAVAPRFHLDADWPGRLTLGTGVDELEGKFFPRGPWRPPAADDLAGLVGVPAVSGSLPMLGDDSGTAGAGHPDDAVCLFQIPEHLRAAWWDLLDAAAETGGPMEGFDAYAAKVGEFLAFKRLGAGASGRVEAIVTAVGERSIRRDPDIGRPSGLGPTVAPWAAWPGSGAPVPRLHAVVNLGDEPSAVVLINLAPAALAAELARREPGAVPATVGELTSRFLRTCPDYPPVRVRLAAGEGCRIPAGGLILDGDPTGKEEPDVLLLVSEDGG